MTGRAELPRDTWNVHCSWCGSRCIFRFGHWQCASDSCPHAPLPASAPAEKETR